MSLIPPTIDKGDYKKEGFSFIEIMVGLIIMSVFLAIAGPSVNNALEKPHKAEFRHLIRLLKLLRNDAILGHVEYFIIFDLNRQQYHVEKYLKEGEREIIKNHKFLKPHTFPEELVLQYVLLARPSSAPPPSQIVQTPVEVRIDGSGFVTPFTLVLEDTENNQFWTISTQNIMGHLEIQEGTHGLF